MCCITVLAFGTVYYLLPFQSLIHELGHTIDIIYEYRKSLQKLSNPKLYIKLLHKKSFFKFGKTFSNIYSSLQLDNPEHCAFVSRNAILGFIFFVIFVSASFLIQILLFSLLDFRISYTLIIFMLPSIVGEIISFLFSKSTTSDKFYFFNPNEFSYTNDDNLYLFAIDFSNLLNIS